MGFLENTHPTRPRFSNIRNDLFIFACHTKRHGGTGLVSPACSTFRRLPTRTVRQGHWQEKWRFVHKTGGKAVCYICVCIHCVHRACLSAIIGHQGGTQPPPKWTTNWVGVLFLCDTYRQQAVATAAAAAALFELRLPEAPGRIIWTLESNRRTQNYQLQSGVGA